jgi:hypothetical protein
MDDEGEIINPGDLHGRTMTANEIKLSWDGNQICALVGKDLVVGVSGFGYSVHEALRDLADRLIAEAVWVEIEDDEAEFTPRQIEPGRTIETNEIELYRSGDAKALVFAGPDEDDNAGVPGYGDSVHEAVRDLVDNLVQQGVWIEVTDRTEWHLEDIDE